MILQQDSQNETDTFSLFDFCLPSEKVNAMEKENEIQSANEVKVLDQYTVW